MALLWRFFWEWYKTWKRKVNVDKWRIFLGRIQIRFYLWRGNFL